MAKTQFSHVFMHVCVTLFYKFDKLQTCIVPNRSLGTLREWIWHTSNAAYADCNSYQLCLNSNLVMKLLWH